MRIWCIKIGIVLVLHPVVQKVAIYGADFQRTLEKYFSTFQLCDVQSKTSPPIILHIFYYQPIYIRLYKSANLLFFFYSLQLHVGQQSCRMAANSKQASTLVCRENLINLRL
jgi:hypothetical protein